MIMSIIIIASSILMRSIQTTVLSLKNYNIAKKYGKNKVVFKKLVLDEETRIENENGIDCKSIFKNLIGFEFLSERVKDKIKITGFDGESFFIKTRLPVEVT